MPTAATLPQAAGQSFVNLFNLWQAGGNAFKTSVAGFAAQLLPVFPDQEPVGRPIANWLTAIAAIAFQMPSGVAPTKVDYATFFVTANEYIYRLCWLASKSSPQSPDITPTQQQAVLDTYNSFFAF